MPLRALDTAPEATPTTTPTQETWVSVAEAASLEGVTDRHLRRLVGQGAVRSRLDGRRRWVALDSLSVAAQAERERRLAPRVQTVYQDLPGRSRSAKAREAARRYAALEQFFGLPRRQRTAEALAELQRTLHDHVDPELAHERELTTRRNPATYKRIWDRAREHGQEYTLGRLGPRKVPSGTVLPQEARAYLARMWVNDEAREYVTAWRTYSAVCAKHDWPEVSCRTVERYLKSLPADVVALGKKGERAFGGQDSPYVTMDYTAIPAGAFWNGDHHQFDVLVRDEQDGHAFRPWLTGWQDLRSRALWGWAMVEAPNSTTIVEALLHGLRPKDRPEHEQMCGAPDTVRIDNGKDYRSKLVEGEQVPDDWREGEQVQVRGILQRLNITVTRALPYNAKNKPIERFFGSLCRDFAKRMDTYWGASPATRPERTREMLRQHQAWLRGKRADTPLPTLGELRELFDRWLVLYHQRTSRALSGGGRKLSPLDVIRLYGQAPRMVRDESLELLAMTPERRVVQKGGTIQWAPYCYAHDRLIPRRGERVLACRPQGELGRIYVYSAREEFICEAVSVEGLRADAGPEEGQAHIEKQKRYMRQLREARAAVCAGAPDDAPSPKEVLLQQVGPAQAGAHFSPQDTVRHVVPSVDRVALRQQTGPRDKLRPTKKVEPPVLRSKPERSRVKQPPIVLYRSDAANRRHR